MKDTDKEIVVNLSEKSYEGLGEAIRTMRKEREVSQQELGVMVMRDRTGLSHYERASNVPTLYAVSDIAEALHYDFIVKFSPKVLKGEDLAMYELSKNKVKDCDSMNELEYEKGNQSNNSKEVFSSEFIENFINGINDESSFSYNVFNEIDGLKEEWVVSEQECNQVQLKSSSGKVINMGIVCDSEIKNDLGRFVNIYVCTRQEDTVCTWGFYRDLNDETFNVYKTDELVSHINDCIYIGEILSCNEDLNGIINDMLQYDKLRLVQYDSYAWIKQCFNMNDEDILDVVNELYPNKKDNPFIGILSSNYNCDLEKREVAKKVDECISRFISEGFIPRECKCSITNIINILKLSDAIDMLVWDGSIQDIEDIMYVDDIIKEKVIENVLLDQLRDYLDIVNCDDNEYDAGKVILNILQICYPNTNIDYI